MWPAGSALGLAVGVTIALTSVPADAFECVAVPACPEDNPGCPEAGNVTITQAWNQRCVPVWIRRNDPIFSGAEVETIVQSSLARWTSELACTDFELLFLGYTDQGGGFDVQKPDEQQNVVLSVQGPTEAAGYFDDPGLLAITLTTFSQESGEILDADIVFNDFASDFDVVDDPVACLRAGRQVFDIENTLVHEIGHFFGFDHVEIRDATMFEMAGRCETKKRDLDADDELAMCTVYASGQPPRTCLPPQTYEIGGISSFRNQCDRALDEGCGCSTAKARDHRRGEPWASVIGIGMVGFAIARARRGRRRKS